MAAAAARPKSPASTTRPSWPASSRPWRAPPGSRATECLDVCEHGNVIVVQPSAEGRAAGGRPVWLGLVNDADAIEDIAAWVGAGGPGLADPPGILDLYAFSPSRRVRQALPGGGAERG